MEPREHPLRRMWWLELALGIAAVLIAWRVLGREERPGRTRAPAPLDRVEREAAAPAQPVRLASPEILAEGEAAPRREELAERPGEAAAGGATSSGPGTSDPPARSALEEALTVLVLDALGTPAAGVPVGLQIRTDPPSSGPSEPPLLTDASGTAGFPLSAFRRQEERARPLATRFQHRVAVLLPIESAPSLDLGAGVPAPGLVTLRLPPTGRLLVHVRNEDGTPAGPEATVYLSGPGLNASTEVRAGSAEFPYLGLGLELHLRASLVDQSTLPGELDLSGPARAGETVEATLQLGPEWPRIVFRAVDGAGAPLANTRLELRIFQEPLSPQAARSWTDAAGRSELRVLGSHRPRHARTLTIETGEPPPRGARIDLTVELARGKPTELGDVVLSAAGTELLAAGTVLGERGPLAGVELTLRHEDTPRMNPRSTRSDAAGRFEFRGLAPPGRLRLTASAPRHVDSAPLEIAPGTSGIVLELARGAPFEPELILDEGILPGDLLLLLHDGQTVHQVPPWRTDTLLPAGTYLLEVRTAQAWLPVESLAGIVLSPDGPADGRLRPLDLRGRLVRASFRLRDVEGQELARVPVRVCADDACGEAVVQDGRLVLLIPRSTLVLELAPLGYLPQRCSAARAEQVLTFERPWAARSR